MAADCGAVSIAVHSNITFSYFNRPDSPKTLFRHPPVERSGIAILNLPKPVALSQKEWPRRGLAREVNVEPRAGHTALRPEQLHIFPLAKLEKVRPPDGL